METVSSVIAVAAVLTGIAAAVLSTWSLATKRERIYKRIIEEHSRIEAEVLQRQAKIKASLEKPKTKSYDNGE